MSFLGIDLGGTKLAFGVFNSNGKMLFKETQAIENRKGTEVGKLIVDGITKIIDSVKNPVESIGISVPGIYHIKNGNVWAPNIPGWEKYPLMKEVEEVIQDIPVTIDSDRACYILGEQWQGNARGCSDAIYLSVGTGIGAGILVNGNVLRGAHDIGGAIGWMALSKPFKEEYTQCGCFETYASGEGIARLARLQLENDSTYQGELRNVSGITSYHIFEAYKKQDTLSVKVIGACIEFWGMAAANLISLFNPEKIIFGGGVFGPAVQFIPSIKEEATKWAQPISMKQVSFESSALNSDAGLYGAAFLAYENINPTFTN